MSDRTIASQYSIVAMIVGPYPAGPCALQAHGLGYEPAEPNTPSILALIRDMYRTVLRCEGAGFEIKDLRHLHPQMAVSPVTS